MTGTRTEDADETAALEPAVTEAVAVDPVVPAPRSRHRAGGRATSRLSSRRRPAPGGVGALVGPLRAGQVVVWEVALLAVVLVWPHGLTPRIVTITLAVLLVVASVLRVQGLLAHQWLVALLRFRLRSRRPAPTGPDPVSAALPDLVLRAHFDRAGNHVGLASVRQSRWLNRPGGRSDAGVGWAGVVRVSGSGGTDAPRLAEVMTAAYESSDLGLAAAQLVSWTVPGPDDGPPLSTHWLAVHYQPAASPLAARARGGGVEGALRTTAVATLGLARDLTEAGYVCSVLDESELRQEITVALGADVLALPGGTVRVAETWRTWSIGRLQQTVYRPRRFVRALARFGAPVPGAEFSCWSLTVRHDRLGRLRRELSLRVGAESPVEVPAVLTPLVGRQAAFVRSTLPLAAD